MTADSELFEGSSDAAIEVIPVGQLGMEHLGKYVRIKAGAGEGLTHGRLGSIYAPKPHLRTLTVNGSILREVSAGTPVSVLVKEDQ